MFGSAIVLCGAVLAVPIVGHGQEAPPPVKRQTSALFSEPHALTTALDFVAQHVGDGNAEARGSDGKDGFYPAFGNMISGAGWIAIGPGYRFHSLDGHAFIDASAAISWRGYKTAQAQLEFTNLARSRVALGSQVLWQDLTQVNYFGLGDHSLEANRSEYRIKSTDVVGYARYQPKRWLSVTGRFGRLDQPTLSSSVGPFDRDYPDARVRFADEPAMSLERQPSFVHADLSMDADTRDYPGHPTHGGVYRAAWSAYSDRDLGTFSFRRYETEAVHFVPLHRSNWIIALHGWVVITDTSAGERVPVYLTPSLGGANTLRGYSGYRFHDRNLLLASAESRWAIFTHVDAAAFVDAGSVKSRAGDLRLANAAYGLGIRAHSLSSTTVRLDVAHSREGWHFFVRLNDSFRLSRLARRTAAIPFVP